MDREWVKKSYWGIVQGENFLGSFLLLAIRLYWGSLLISTGLGKWMHIQGVADFFGTLNIPFPLFSAYLVGTVEFLGGISLFAGFLTRISSIFLVITFIVAYATAHVEAFNSFFVKPSLFTGEHVFLFFYASLIILCFGPGFISIDYWMERKIYGEAL